MRLQRKQKIALSAWASGKRGPEETEEMHAALGPHLTEAALDAAMAGNLGTIDEIPDEELAPAEPEPLPAPVAAAVEKVVEEKVAEVVEQKVEAEVEEQIAVAEEKQTDEEKKSGFWKRVGGFFKGIFGKKGK
jgi:hypothetical protein